MPLTRLWHLNQKELREIWGSQTQHKTYSDAEISDITNISVAMPADSRREKMFDFVREFAVKNFRIVPVRDSTQQNKALNFSGKFRVVFRTIFRFEIKAFRGSFVLQTGCPNKHAKQNAVGDCKAGGWSRKNPGKKKNIYI